MKESTGGTVSLKEYFERILEEKDKAVSIALASAKEAVGVAEKNAEKWRDNANEWRQAMNDRENKFMSRAEFDAYKESAQIALGLEKSRGDKGEGRGIGQHNSWLIFVAVIGVIGGIIGILSRFL